MSDLLAGTVVKGNDTPPTVTDAEPDSFSFTITTFGVTTSSGTYVECGVVFIAPTTGRVLISWDGDLSNNTGGVATYLCPVVRTGGTIGSGTSFFAATIQEAIHVGGTSGHHFGRTHLLTGLTAGSTYNARLEHRVGSASTGTASRRHLIVAPAT